MTTYRAWFQSGAGRRALRRLLSRLSVQNRKPCRLTSFAVGLSNGGYHDQRGIASGLPASAAVAVLLRRTVLLASWRPLSASRLVEASPRGFSAARLIAGLDRASFARPAASAALVFSSTPRSRLSPPHRCFAGELP